jgi:hypothetical protein
VSTKGGGGSGGGYTYSFDILMGLSRGPIDQLVAIWVGDLEAWPNLSNFIYPTPNPSYVVSIAGTDPGALSPTGSPTDFGGEYVMASQQFLIYAPNLFGGEEKEGGIYGSAILNMGHPTQTLDLSIPYSISQGTKGYAYAYADAPGAPGNVGGVGGATNNGDYDRATNTIIYDTSGDDYGTVEQFQYISQFRGVATLWYSGMVCQNNPYPKTWKFRLRRSVQGWDKNGCWYPDLAQIPYSNSGYAGGSMIVGMNPAHILYQCITDRNWGRGMDRAELDDSSWSYAANYLYNEGFGLCIRWSKDGDLDEFIQTVIDHISAVIYVDRGTGLLCLRLLRDDYDAATLPVFNYASGILKIEAGETGATNILANEVVVKYFDPITATVQQTRAQNLASIQGIDSVISNTKEFPGIAWQSLAQRCAVRELLTQSIGLKKFKINMDRRGWKLQPGSVFVLNAPDKGIASMVVRVATYDDGTLIDGTIKLDCLQDMFAMPSTSFGKSVPSTWQGPLSTKAPILANRNVYEATYYDMVVNLTAAQFQAVTVDEGGIVAVAQKPLPNVSNFIVWTTPEGAAAGATAGYGQFSPTGFVSLAQAGSIPGLDYYDTALQLTSGTGLSTVVVGSSAVVDQEIIRIDAFNATTGAATIARGCADTIPQQHEPTSIVFFNDSTLCGFTTPYAEGESVAVQLLSNMASSQLSPSKAPTDTIVIAARWAKPYPPADVKVNGTLGLTTTGITVVGSAVLTWVERNRVTQNDQLIAHTDGTVSPEAGTTYTVEVWDHDAGTLLRTHAGITGTTWTYSVAEADEYSDPVAIDLHLYSVCNSLSSFQHYVLFIERTDTAIATGYGNRYGYSYGES